MIAVRPKYKPIVEYLDWAGNTYADLVRMFSEPPLNVYGPLPEMYVELESVKAGSAA